MDIETVEREAWRRAVAVAKEHGSGSPGSLHAQALEDLITEHRTTKAELEAFKREAEALRAEVAELRRLLWRYSASEEPLTVKDVRDAKAALEQGEVK
jgi:hypothetical protein